MAKLDQINIHDEKGINFYCDYSSLEKMHDEIEEFVSSEESMNNLKFSKTVMFSHELQYNNLVEGYKDDLTEINDVIKNTGNITDEEKRLRILNLYRGYQYILRHKDINKDSLKDLYSFIDTTQVNLMPLVQGGLVSLAQKEASGEYTDDQLDEARKDFFNISLYHLSIPKATSLVNFVTDFANHILIPNSVDKSQNVFDYYQLSVGRFDKWSSQSYTNRRNYIAYLDTILLSAANLAIFDASHRIENISDDASKKSIETSFNNMIKAVNSVNKMFQNELTRLEEYKKLEENKQIKYLPTNTIYSTRLATMTYDFNSDKQGFVKTLATKDNKKFNGMGLLFQASNIVDKVAKDYSDYMKTWKVKDYSLVKYLKDAGFYANDSKAFETSLKN